MLDKAKMLQGYRLKAMDGEMGKIEEFHFDDRHWAICYLVANTGSWLSGRQVLISPQAISAIDRVELTISVHLTKKQIEVSPFWDRARPMTDQFGESYHSYYGCPFYWDNPSVLGTAPRNLPRTDSPIKLVDKDKTWKRHLHSTRDLTGHFVEANDGEIGRIDDFVIDDEAWTIRYLVVATRNWWPGKKVLISPRWITKVYWHQSVAVNVNLLREDVWNSPEYTDDTLLTLDHEAALHRHYKLPGY